MDLRIERALDLAPEADEARSRLRVYADGRIEGIATLAPEQLHPPKRSAS